MNVTFALSHIFRDECPKLIDSLNRDVPPLRPWPGSYNIELPMEDSRVVKVKEILGEHGFSLIPPAWNSERVKGQQAKCWLTRHWSAADLAGLRYVRMHADGIVSGKKDPTPEGVVPVLTDWVRKNAKRDFGADNGTGWLLSARAAALFRAVGVSDSDVLWRPTIAWASSFAGMKQHLQPLDWWSMKPLKTLPPMRPEPPTDRPDLDPFYWPKVPCYRPDDLAPVVPFDVAIGTDTDRLFDSLIISRRLYEAIRAAKLTVKPEYFSPVWIEGVDGPDRRL